MRQKLKKRLNAGADLKGPPPTLKTFFPGTKQKFVKTSTKLCLVYKKSYVFRAPQHLKNSTSTHQALHTKFSLRLPALQQRYITATFCEMHFKCSCSCVTRGEESYSPLPPHWWTTIYRTEEKMQNKTLLRKFKLWRMALFSLSRIICFQLLLHKDQILPLTGNDFQKLQIYSYFL